jgi:hypothetical protein
VVPQGGGATSALHCEIGTASGQTWGRFALALFLFSLLVENPQAQKPQQKIATAQKPQQKIATFLT